MKKTITSIILITCILSAYIPVISAEELALTPVFSGTGINQYGGLKNGDVHIETGVTTDNAMVICALTDRVSGVLKDISVGSQSGDITVPDDGLYSLKVMCWDKDMTQLCTPFVLEDYNPLIDSYNPPVVFDSFDDGVPPELYVWADTEYGACADVTFDGSLRMDYNRQHYGCQVQYPVNSDWSGYTGLQFDIWGTQNSIVYARINDGTKTRQTNINVTESKQKVKINFADFDGISLSSIKAITFFVHSNGTDDRSGEGYFTVDDIFLTSPVREVVPTQILTNMNGSCYTDENITLYAQLISFSEGEQALPVTCEVTNTNGEVVLRHTITATWSTEEVPFSFKLTEYGYFTAKITALNNSISAPFVRIPQQNNAPAPDGYKQGYSVHFDSLKSYTQQVEEADMLKKQGCNIIRQDFLWDIIEPDDAGYDWSFYDNMVELMNQRDIEIIGLITYSNRQNSAMDLYGGVGKGNFRRYPPVDLEKWGKYVYDTVSRYKDSIKIWEMWNEANIFFWEQDPAITENTDEYRARAYLPLLKVSYLAAKKADPDCIVTMSGMSDIGDIFVNRLLTLGGEDYMDALNIHPYMAKSVELTDSWSDRNYEKKILRTREKAPTLPIYVTEWGWKYTVGTPEDIAVWNTKGIVYQRTAGVSANTMYSYNLLTDRGMGHISPGLNGMPTAQFAAVAANNYILGDYSCVGALGSSTKPYFGIDTFAAYFEAEGQQPVIALWLTNEAVNQRVNIPTSREITIFDMYGNAEKYTPYNGKVSLMLDNKPVYIKGDFEDLKGEACLRFKQTERPNRDIKTIVQARADYYFSTPRILKQNETYTLQIRIVNYSGEATQGTLKVEGMPENWLNSTSFDYIAEEGKSAVVSVEITPSAMVQSELKLKAYDEGNPDMEEMTYYFKGE